jgi:hypothetical protein
VTLDHIVVAVTLDTIVAFVIPLVAQLTSSLMWCKERFWNFSVLPILFTEKFEEIDVF